MKWATVIKMSSGETLSERYATYAEAKAAEWRALQSGFVAWVIEIK